MAGIAAVLVLVSISVVVTRVGAAAFVATGVSPDLAHFQARSAFTGVGYTTSEAEAIAGHPVRRRIVLTLMLLGNAGIVSVVASLVLGFAGASQRAAGLRLGVLLIGLAILWAVTRTERFNRWATRIIGRSLERWTDLDVHDYVDLLGVSGRYAVRELEVDEGAWLQRGRLRDLDLTSEGVLVLGIRRESGEYLGAPTADTQIEAGDTVILYGRADQLGELGERPAGAMGDDRHRGEVEHQRHVQAAEQAGGAQARAEREADRAAREGRHRDAVRHAAIAEEGERRSRQRQDRADGDG